MISSSPIHQPDPIGIEELPLRDMQAALKIAAGSEAIAEDILREFISILPAAIREIQEVCASDDWQAMWKQVHSLHGSTAICGVPALHRAVSELEKAIKLQSKQHVAILLSVTSDQAERLITHYA